MSESTGRPVGTPWMSDPKYRWFQEAKFGLFIHWGLYALTAGRWKGEHIGGLGENIQMNVGIPMSEYGPLAERFNPVRFDADAWVKLAADAGMRYLVITAKHSDGFSMYDTKVTDYNIVARTPFKRDIVKELADACHTHGLTFCFYYSQVLDCHHPDADGGAPEDKADEKDFQRFLDEKVKPQLRELLTGYGPVGLIWFDVPCTITAAQCEDLADFVHGIQPDCLCNSRLGHGFGEYLTAEDNGIPTAGFDKPWETPATMNDTWGFKHDDPNFKSPSDLIGKLVEIVSKGGNYLLNVGPTAAGVIPGASVRSLQEIGKWMAANSESIHGAQPNPLPDQYVRRWGRCTAKEGKLFLHVFRWPADDVLQLPGVGGTVTRAYLLADPDKTPLEVAQPGGSELCIHIPAGELPQEFLSPIDTVVAVEFEGKMAIGWRLIVPGDVPTKLPSFEALLHGENLKYAASVWDASIATAPTWGEGADNWAKIPPAHVVDRLTCLTNWRTTDDSVTWQVRIETPGEYAVSVTYGCDDAWIGGKFTVAAAGQTLAGTVESTETWYEVKAFKLGAVTFDAPGDYAIEVTAASLAGEMLMNLDSVTLART